MEFLSNFGRNWQGAKHIRGTVLARPFASSMRTQKSKQLKGLFGFLRSVYEPLKKFILIVTISIRSVIILN